MLLVQELALVPTENTLGASALVTPSVHTRELKPVANNSILSPCALEKSVMVSIRSEGELNLNLSAPSPPVRNKPSLIGKILKGENVSNAIC